LRARERFHYTTQHLRQSLGSFTICFSAGKIRIQNSFELSRPKNKRDFLDFAVTEYFGAHREKKIGRGKKPC
jgi:hypothetical protein